MRRTILYLDDEAACVDVFHDMFGDEFDIRTATTLSEARRALAERAADIVISDQRMPDIDGTDFLREVSKSYPASYRMMLTGSATLGELIREISDGIVNLFIAKPWTEQNMRQILESAAASFERRNRTQTAYTAAPTLGEAISGTA